MDIERINGVLGKAIAFLQEGEIEGLVEGYVKDGSKLPPKPDEEDFVVKNGKVIWKDR